MGGLKAVLFDLDGTLIDPKQGITECLRYALTILGRDCPSENELAVFIGPPIRDTFRNLLRTHDETLTERAVARYRARFAEHGLEGNRLYPGIREVIEEIKNSGYVLLVATSKLTAFAVGILERLAEKLLRRSLWCGAGLPVG